jgi:hypothetical protein
MSEILKKSFKTPEETRTFPKGRLEIVTLDGITIGKSIFEPGWRWTEVMPPIAKTATCQAAHTNYILSGRLHVKMDDGTDKEYGPGDVGIIPPGHDAWVIGNEPCVMIDYTGAAHYAEQH